MIIHIPAQIVTGLLAKLQIKQAMETDRLVITKRAEILSYPQPLSLSWRLFHFINYMIGGSTFFTGEC